MRRVVIVEDEPDIRDLLRLVLEEAGFDVTVFNAPAPALEVETEPVDIFLVDLMLPDMTGTALARVLRSSGHANTPIVAMSASRQMVEHARATRLFQAVVAKPFEITELVECIQYYANPAATAAS